MSGRVTCTPKRICRWWSGNSDIPISKGKSCWMWQEATNRKFSDALVQSVYRTVARSCGARTRLCNWQHNCASHDEENVSINCAISQLHVFMWPHWRRRLWNLRRKSSSSLLPLQPSHDTTGHRKTVPLQLTSESLGSHFTCDQRREHDATAHDTHSI